MNGALSKLVWKMLLLLKVFPLEIPRDFFEEISCKILRRIPGEKETVEIWRILWVIKRPTALQYNFKQLVINGIPVVFFCESFKWISGETFEGIWKSFCKHLCKNHWVIIWENYWTMQNWMSNWRISTTVPKTMK